MFEANSNQLNCLADLVLIAFLGCLAPREASISLAQLHTRNFAPHQQATRDCIYYLFKQGRVEISPFVQKRRGRVHARDMNISLKLDPPDIPKLIINLSYSIRDKISDTKCELLFDLLDEQLKVYECIEYCQFYLDREGLGLRSDSVQPYKLHLMVMELAHEQVFMLLWRAVKTASIYALKKKEKSVTLNELCDLAYKYFIDYRKRDIGINCYRAPYSVVSSSLRNILVKYKAP